jgi:hypothetical protein
MAIANLVTLARLLAVAPFGYAMPGPLFLEIGAPIRAAEVARELEGRIPFASPFQHPRRGAEPVRIANVF